MEKAPRGNKVYENKVINFTKIYFDSKCISFDESPTLKKLKK